MGSTAGGGTQPSTEGTDTTQLAIGAGTGFMGCLFGPVIILVLLLGTIVACGIGILLWPILLLCQIFGGCGSGDDGGGGMQVDTAQISGAFQGDGKGELIEESVPEEFFEPIEDAGAECPQIGPVVIAAQIQYESMFDKDLVGVGGALGISQLPPGKFKEFGEDDDDSGETSALDAEDSIMAQGRYMCSLAEDIETLAANNEVKGDQLDMTLAAYELGLDAIKKAKGVPDNSRAQSYITGVRMSFALYSGAVEPPEGEPYPTLSPPPLDEQDQGSDEDS